MKKSNPFKQRTGMIAVWLSITAVLFLVGLLIGLSFTGNKVIEDFKENVVIMAYFSRTAPVQGVYKSHRELSQNPQFKKVVLISPEESAALFKDELGNDLMEVFRDNPLPYSVQLYMRNDFKNEPSVRKTIEELKKVPYIYEVDYQEDTLSQLRKNRKRLSSVFLVLVILTLIAALSLIHNSVRLRVYSDRFLVKSMQLVGASEWFIQKPYLRRAFLGGFVCSALAAVLTILPFRFFVQRYGWNSQSNIPSLFSDIRIYILLFVILLITGWIITLSSTYWATKRYLRSKIDDLY